MARLCPILAICGMLCFTVHVSGAFVMLDNFEAYNADFIAPQSDWWDSSSGYGTVGVDPTDFINRALVQGGAGDQFIRFNNGSVLVPNGSTGTLFFRIYANTNAHNGIGLSPVAGATTWADGKPILRIGGTPVSASLHGYDQTLGTYRTLTTQTQTQTWYNVWMVADNAANRTAYYIQSDKDPDFAVQTRIGGDYDLAFRTGVSDGDLLSVFFRTASTAGTVYFDDFYIDSTGENLAKPDLRDAVPVYREIFPNVSGANDLNLSTAGWNSRWGASAANVQRQEVARAFGSPTDVSPVNSDPIDDYVTDYGYLVTHPGPGSYNSGTGGDPVLHWTEEYTVERWYLDVREIQWRQRNNMPADPADDATRVAVRIEDDWFVSEQTFSNTSSSWTLMQLDFGRANWLELDFDPGDSPGQGLLALGGAAPFLPEGNITAFGLFVDDATAIHRIDSFTILAIPEPGSAVLLAIAAACGMLGLPRRRVRS